MIQVLLLDLGGTLVDPALHPLPHVATALEAISSFQTAAGKPLVSALVSDYELATPFTPAKVNAKFKEYLKLLDQTTLRPYFEPVKQRVTLSTHANAMKPDRAVFEKALERLGVKVPLADCLFITEDAGHIQAARTTLKMTALQFGVDFHDWSEAPALIAHQVDPANFANTESALKAHLGAKGVEVVSTSPGPGGKIQVAGHVWQPVSVPGHEDLKDIQVAVPVEGQVKTGAKGFTTAADALRPTPENVDEATQFVRSLAEQGQIADRPGAFRPSHAIETDAEGNRKLVRKRFSAL